MMLILSIQCHIGDCYFFFNDTATTEIYTLSLHDALPILKLSLSAGRRNIRASSELGGTCNERSHHRVTETQRKRRTARPDRKSTRLNSSHSQISYAVFCLKKQHPHTTAQHYHPCPTE